MNTKSKIALLSAVAVVAVAVAAFIVPTRSAALPEVVVYKTPTCGCCVKWVEHLREEGFAVTTHDLNDLSGVKARYGVTGQVASCHTAVVDGYVVEGHVPADQVKRMLDERPEVLGIAAPGMPMGSPGMEMPDGRVDDYDIVTFDAQGQTTVFHHIDGTN